MKPWQMMRVFGQPASGGGGSNPYWANVSSLLHFDGADGSTTFADQKGHVWTPSGNAQIDTAHSKFGGASGLFDGSGDYITAASHADFGFGSSDFTIEAFVRVPSTGSDQTLFDNRTASNTGIGIYSSIIAGGGGQKWGVASNVAVIATGAVLTVNTWIHLAIARQGTTLRGFRNGVQDFSITDSRTYASASQARCGATYVATQPYYGHIDDARVTKGVARYTSAFTPPSAPFPDS